MSEALESAHTALSLEFNPNQESWTFESCFQHVKKGLDLAIRANIPGGRTIVAVEPTIHGRKPDLILRTPEGLMVDDFKVTMSLESKLIQYRQREYYHSWQGHDYAYWVGDYYQEQVAWWRPVLIILGPRQLVVPTPVRLTPEKLRDWKQSAEVVWRRMHFDELHYKEFAKQPPQNFKACTGKAHHFGEEMCPFYDACHKLMGDESAYHSIFRKKEDLWA